MFRYASQIVPPNMMLTNGMPRDNGKCQYMNNACRAEQSHWFDREVRGLSAQQKRCRQGPTTAY